MKIRILGEADAADLERFLERHADSSMFLRSNAELAGVVDRGLPFQGTYAAAYRDGRMVGAVAHYWQGNIVVQAPEATNTLVQAAAEASKREVAGIIGPELQVQEARVALGMSSRSTQLDSADGLYAVDLANLVHPDILDSEGIGWTPISRDDADPVINWFYVYHVELLGSPEGRETRAEAKRRFEGACEQQVGYVLRRGHDREPISYSGFNAQLSRMVQIGGVYTPPHARGRGYARGAVAASLEHVKTRGVTRAILFTGDENRAAIAAYRALGFERMGDFRLLLFA